MPSNETRVTINGLELRLRRMRRGMSQRALSDKTGELGQRTDSSNINKAENHGHGIGPARLLVIAEALGCEVDDLLLIEEDAEAA